VSRGVQCGFQPQRSGSVRTCGGRARLPPQIAGPFRAGAFRRRNIPTTSSKTDKQLHAPSSARRVTLARQMRQTQASATTDAGLQAAREAEPSVLYRVTGPRGHFRGLHRRLTAVDRGIGRIIDMDPWFHFGHSRSPAKGPPPALCRHRSRDSSDKIRGRPATLFRPCLSLTSPSNVPSCMKPSSHSSP